MPEYLDDPFTSQKFEVAIIKDETQNGKDDSYIGLSPQPNGVTGMALEKILQDVLHRFDCSTEGMLSKQVLGDKLDGVVLGIVTFTEDRCKWDWRVEEDFDKQTVATT